MSANPQIYTDAAMTTELGKDGSGNYIFSIGPDNGLDGNLGDSATKQFWIKNNGDEVYQVAKIVENTDANGQVTYSLDNSTYAETVSFGDIAVGSSATFYVKVAVLAGATRGRYQVTFELDGETI